MGNHIRFADIEDRLGRPDTESGTPLLFLMN